VTLSLRGRLALWHAIVLAIILASFAAAAYAFVFFETRARTDSMLSDAVDDVAAQLHAEASDEAAIGATVKEALNELRFRTIALFVYDTSGKRIASNIPAMRAVEEGRAEPAIDTVALRAVVRSTVFKQREFVSLPDAEGGYRALLEMVPLSTGRVIIAAVQSVHGDAELLAQARLAMSLAIPAALVLAWSGGWLVAGRTLAPMVAIRMQAAQIGATNLSERVPIRTPHDEVGELAAVVNELLERLEVAFQQRRQFMADASHELRTPVAIIQNESSLALSRDTRDPAEYREALRVVRDAARRLRQIVNDLFLLARADAGEVPLRCDPVYLDEIISTSVREVRTLADARRVKIDVARLPVTPYVGDESLLHRLVLNLLDNAIKYSPPEATVSLRLVVEDDHLRVEVENTGPAIPVALQAKIFERFVRADQVRAYDGNAFASGTGLGLPIARWIAERHGGTLELVRSDEKSTLFSFIVPKRASRGC
jgi:two-component system, OmpR family, sensor kinase